MTYWQLVPVNFWIHAMHFTSMGCHEPGRQLHPTFHTWYGSPEAIPVSGTIPSDPTTESLL